MRTPLGTIITIDGTLSSVDEAYSLSKASQSYANRIDKGKLAKERLIKERLEDYIPKLLELPILKDNNLIIAREDDREFHNLTRDATVGMFTIICMMVMLASFFVQGELMRFLLAPLSRSGFGVG